MKMKCNEDCLNCKYNKCIYDECKEYHTINLELHIGERLKLALMENAMSQSKLAKLTGLSFPTISGYCNNVRTPRGDHVFIICKTLQISADWLLGIDTTEFEIPQVKAVYNLGIKALIKKCGMKHEEVAKEIGIHPATFSKWLMQPLKDKQYQQILSVIRRHEHD